MSLHKISRQGGSRLVACLLTFAAAASVSAAGAETEIFGGFGIFTSLMSRTYDASYTPPRVGGVSELFGTPPDPRSRSRQILALDGGSSPGWGFGLSLYPHRVFGIQLLLDRSDIHVGGANEPHTVDLVWDSVRFPTTEPVVLESSYSFETPDTDARLKMLIVSLNAAARWKAGDRVSGSVSAGASYFRGRAEGLRVGGLSGFLGGHAVFTRVLYEMSLDTENARKLGFNLGAEASVSLGSNLALFADGRLYLAPAAPAATRLTGFVETPLVEAPLDRIERYLALPKVELDPRQLRLIVGLSWRP